ncbi:MAG: tRNA 2-thiouridine(34) synthase MnmA [Thermodesulfobacteriota bacterium]
MRTAVAFSGGADSLFALLALRQAGHEVLALHARFLPEAAFAEHTERLHRCCDAAGVDLEIIDLQHQFAEAVIRPFVQQYARGLTPNPCALCNQHIKFGLLRDSARQLGCEGFATGHYVQLRHTPKGPVLCRGSDPRKEQSYFLSLVAPHALDNCVFPLGSRQKSAIQQALREQGQTVPESRESQEVCFIPDNDYRSFLEQSGAPLSGPGPIVDRHGSHLGQHNGLWRYTLGQRRGLGIAYSEPLYVIAKEIKANRLVVGPRAERQAWGCVVGDLNAFLPLAQWPEQLEVQTNYRQQPVACRIRATADTRLEVDFLEPKGPAAPGQVATFYTASGCVLGGGIIHDRQRTA